MAIDRLLQDCRGTCGWRAQRSRKEPALGCHCSAKKDDAKKTLAAKFRPGRASSHPFDFPSVSIRLHLSLSSPLDSPPASSLACAPLRSSLLSSPPLPSPVLSSPLLSSPLLSSPLPSSSLLSSLALPFPHLSSPLLPSTHLPYPPLPSPPLLSSCPLLKNGFLNPQ